MSDDIQGTTSEAANDDEINFVKEEYSTFTNNSIQSNHTLSTSLAHGRSKRNRKACLRLSGDDFVNLPSRQSKQFKKPNGITEASKHLSLKKTLNIKHEPSLPPIKFDVGCLVWARISGHPWWPCMICEDQEGSKEYTKLSGARHARRTSFVEFFGPTVEHAWIPDYALIEYNGMDAFKDYAQKKVDEAPTKVLKERLAERFQLKVALSKRNAWEEAVKEADRVKKMSVEERIKWRNNKITRVVVTKQKAIPTKQPNPSPEPSHVDTNESKNAKQLKKSKNDNQIQEKESVTTSTTEQISSDDISNVYQKALQSCGICRKKFNKVLTVVQISNHIMECCINKLSKGGLSRCPFCQLSLSNSEYTLHKIRLHIRSCCKKMTAKKQSEPISTDTGDQAPTSSTNGENENKQTKIIQNEETTIKRECSAATIKNSPPKLRLRSLRKVLNEKEKIQTEPTIEIANEESTNKNSEENTNDKEKQSEPTTTSTKEKKRLIIQRPSQVSCLQMSYTRPTAEPSIIMSKSAVISSIKRHSEVDVTKSMTTPDICYKSVGDIDRRFIERCRALESVSKGLSIESAAEQFKLPVAILDQDFNGDFSSIPDKGVILGRLDLACSDIEEGSRASLAAIKYRLPYKYLQMIIRGKSQEYAIEQFNNDFNDWKNNGQKRSCNTSVEVDVKRPRFEESMISSYDVSLNTSVRTNSMDASQTNQRINHSDFLISDDTDLNQKVDCVQNSCDPAFGISSEDEIQLVNYLLKLTDPSSCYQQAVLMAKSFARHTVHEKSHSIGRDWWFYLLLKYPNLRNMIVSYNTKNNSSRTSSEYVLLPTVESRKSHVSFETKQESASQLHASRKSERIAKRKSE